MHNQNVIKSSENMANHKESKDEVQTINATAERNTNRMKF